MSGVVTYYDVMDLKRIFYFGCVKSVIQRQMAALSLFRYIKKCNTDAVDRPGWRAKLAQRNLGQRN
jgi:hypothetical protein